MFIACVVSWLKLAYSDKKITRNVSSKSEKYSHISKPILKVIVT